MLQSLERMSHSPTAKPKAADDPLLTPAEAAAALGNAVSAETIRRWMRKGAIPVVRVGPYRRAMIRLSVALSQLTPP